MSSKHNQHYVNNADFSDAVVEYVTSVRKATKDGQSIPPVTYYIAKSFLRIANGLSHKANFVRYTYREEMVMDAVENCLKAISNYNLEVATRTGKPNAFAYFTQIAWYAFLRRIEKEKRQQDIKLKYIAESCIDEIIAEEINGDNGSQETQAFIDELRERIDAVKVSDDAVKTYAKKEKIKRTRKADSDLSEFL